MIVQNLIGQVFGRLTVLEKASNSAAGKARWKCQCQCLNFRDCLTGSLRSGRQLSCGCLRVERLRKTLFLPNGEGAVGDLYRAYKFKAAKRKLPFLLTRDQFRKLIFQPCLYCNFPPSRVKKTRSGSTVTYNGIDRSDNSKGYTVLNSVPCCTDCNFAKGRRNADEFLKWLDRFKVTA
jgi:hypothetical protein